MLLLKISYGSLGHVPDVTDDPLIIAYFLAGISQGRHTQYRTSPRHPEEHHQRENLPQ
jgi:hypothetical protein